MGSRLFPRYYQLQGPSLGDFVPCIDLLKYLHDYQNYISCHRIRRRSEGLLTENEVCFYILDTIPMLFLVGIFVFVWPPRCIEEPIGITSPLPMTMTNMK
ncbi:hypothetical protein CNBG_10114 [Cryptococcus deuterogattii R265]|uniref:uncharacterized protein n=1 Tax=Cryptococcus deuterogattii (strain R265) TaxID=294750 RepID=UPI001937E2EB|nr:hypothetical protein CNBG_10114 [Cryptococcus deuterogattii R265]